MKIAVVILSVLLLSSNAFWLYQVLDIGVTLSYRDQQTDELEETRKQLMAILPEIAKNATKEEIVSAAGRYTDMEVYEKDGCTWVGMLGFKFDENSKLKYVSPVWSYGKTNPCFSAF